MPRKAIFRNGCQKITIRFSKEVYEWLRKKAEEEGTEIAKIVRKCIFEAMRREKNESG